MLDDFWELVSLCFTVIWDKLGQIPFFMFGFSFKEFILGGILTSVAVTVLGRFIHNHNNVRGVK